MKAIARTEYGSAEVLRFVDAELPVPKDDQVLVRVKAAGLDAGAWHMMTGTPLAMRPVVGFRAPRTSQMGMDVAGVIESVGAAVTGLKPGDEVFGVADGSFAEFAVSKPKNLVPKPANLSFAQAAVSPISAQTALQAFRLAGGVVEGQQVLVIGASGGVGSFAVQLAAASGAIVTGVCSAAKEGFVRSLGATHVVDYRTSSIADAGVRYDIIIDMAGLRSVSSLRAVLSPTGALVLGGGEGGGKVLGGLERQIFGPLSVLFSKQRIHGLVGLTRQEDLLEVARLLADGTLVPAIDSTFPLAETVDAMRAYVAGSVRGKIAIAVPVSVA